MVTCDGAGASHGLIERLDELAARRGHHLVYSVGWELGERERATLAAVPIGAWQIAIGPRGQARERRTDDACGDLRYGHRRCWIMILKRLWHSRIVGVPRKAKGRHDMDPSRNHVDTGDRQQKVSWDAAGKIASSLLPPDNSSLEADVFTNVGRQLLQALIYDMKLSSDKPDRLLSACHSYLEAEQVGPGSVVARLLASDSPEVVSVAKKVQTRGQGWVVTETPQKNLVVLTVLMNLPDAL